MNLAAIVLRLSALAYGGIGAAFLVAPAFMASLVGVSLETVTADNDVRAVYGGLGGGLGLFFALGSARPDWHSPALSVLVLTAGAMAAARVLSWLVVGLPAPIGYLLHAAEILGLGAGALALRRLESA
jgi:hypothetical protein